MKSINTIGLQNCSFQAHVFEESIENTEYSSPIFIRRYMCSEFADRFDRGGMIIEPTTPQSVFRQLDEEYGPSTYGKEKYSKNEIHWIGYIYRYWVETREISSKHAYKIAKPSELRELYLPYHTLDPNNAISRIYEAKGIIEDSFEEAVQYLKHLNDKD